jgi:chemotaxis protein methyltransferase CheR
MPADASDLWRRASAIVARRLGLHFPMARVGELRRAFTDAALELGLGTAEACAQRLVAGDLGPAELDVIASHLTIGETYFFRGDETFKALADHVLPGLIRARRGREQRLRLWSAGCCTGEEAYSLAILLRQLLPDIQDWHITLLATDINPKFLAKAAEAVYGQWSFRGTPEAFRARYFSRATDGRYALAPEIKRMVTLAPLNLAEGMFPSLATGTNAMDLILCRNVLMYFTPEQARRAAAGLHASLSGDGWLVVAPYEVSQSLFPDLAQVTFDGAILYQRKAAAASRTSDAWHIAGDTSPVEVPLTEPAQPHLPRRHLRVRRRPEDIGRAAIETVREAPAPAGLPATTARALEVTDLSSRARLAANQGRLADALVWCDRWIAQDRIDATAHYLRAMVLMELGKADEAKAALQRCAFLDPSTAMANFALANLERSLGHRRAALLHYRTTLRLLERCPPDAPLRHSEDITAAQLSALVGNLLATEAAE